MLKAANKSPSRIDQKVAEIMSKESKEVNRPDLVMVPSKKSKTGWKYINQAEFN